MIREEQETIIRFDATPDKASVYSCDPVWIRKMEKLVESGHATLRRDLGDGKEWYVDKNLVRIRSPKPRTEKQKAASAGAMERLQARLESQGWGRKK